MLPHLRANLASARWRQRCDARMWGRDAASSPRVGVIALCCVMALILGGCAQAVSLVAERPHSRLPPLADVVPAAASAETESARFDKTQRETEREALDEMGRQLAAASWVAVSDWSPETSSAAHWRFGDGPIVPRRWTTASLGTLATEHRDGVEPWRGVWQSDAASERLEPLNSPEDRQRFAAAVVLVHELRTLAKRSDETGSAAAVALTYWRPQEGRAILSKLETIVRRAEIVREQPPASDARDSDGKKSADEAGSKVVASKDATNKSRSDAARPLPKIVRTHPVSTSFRCAAAEAWCLALATQPGDVERALAPAGRAAGDESLTPAVRAELFRALAHWIDPSTIPGLGPAFEPKEAPDGSDRQTPVELRRGAIDACLIHAWTQRRAAEARAAQRERAGGAIESTSRQAALSAAWRDAAARPIDFLGGEWNPGEPEQAEQRSDAPAARRAGDPEWDASVWPASIHRARLDANAAVRLTYARWLAVANAPDALAKLKNQLNDAEPHVREEACVSLGLVGTAGAAVELQACAQKPDEKLRAAAVRGLIVFGPPAVAKLTEDSSSRVRVAVAESLASQRTAESALLLRTLIEDEDPTVQRRAALSTRSWPDRLAIPLLLRGLEGGTLKTRELCWREISRRAEIHDDFPIDASEDERHAAARKLVAAHRLPTALPLTPSRLSSRSSEDSVTSNDVTRVLLILQSEPTDSPDGRLARRAAARWKPGDLPVIARALHDLPQPLPAEVEAEILAPLHPAFASLPELGDRDVFVRRRAAQAIAASAGAASLPGLLLRQLADRLIHEQDQSVWRSLMAAAAADGTPEAAQLAELAAHQAWPDLRVLGCEYAARHGQPAFAAWLLPLLSDSNRAVQTAAVRAAGACANPLLLDGSPAARGGPALPGLRGLLNTTDPALRLAVLEAMSRLGDEQGMHELERLTYAESPETRAAAIRALGTTGQTRFADRLVDTLATETNAAARRAALEALENLVPPESRPARLGVPATEDAKIRAWRDWRQRRSATHLRL